MSKKEIKRKEDLSITFWQILIASLFVSIRRMDEWQGYVEEWVDFTGSETLAFAEGDP